MKPSRVWINCRPRLYTDLFKVIFQSIEQIEVISLNNLFFSAAGGGFIGWENVDVVVLSLGQDGQPDLELVPEPLPNVKMVAFSLSGDFGMRRLLGENKWEEIRPFGLDQLLNEVTSASVSQASS